MSCNEFQDLILSGLERPDVADHVAHCSRCREFLEACERLDKAFRRAPRPTLPADFSARVRRRIAAQPPRGRAEWLPLLLDAIGYGSLALAAGLLIQSAPLYGVWTTTGAALVAAVWFRSEDGVTGLG